MFNQRGALKKWQQMIFKDYKLYFTLKSYKHLFCTRVSARGRAIKNEKYSTGYKYSVSIQCEQNSRVQQRVQQCAISYLWKPHYCGQLSPHLCL